MDYINNLLNLYAKNFAKAKYAKFNNFLVRLGLKGLGLYNYQNLSISGELFFLDKYLSSLKEPIIFDIGANQGAYALLCQQINPSSKIFCFEPHPRNFTFLKEQINSSDIFLFNQGLSDTPGKLVLYDYKNKNGSSHATLCEGVIETVHSSESTTIEVDISTIDTIIREYDIAQIHLLKIDVEGHELQVLKGAKQAIELGIIDVIQFEFTQINSTSRIFMKDFFNLLEKQYSLYRLLPSDLLPLGKYNPTMHEIFGYQNIVCFKRGINVF